MTIYTLILYTAIAGGIFTGVSSLLRKPENWAIDFIKNFVGCLFIFSGFVKAIDPMGTAFKMEQYLAEFNLMILAPLSLTGSVFMIVLEIVLGIALLLGVYRKWTVWIMVPLIGFFTLLTGYTSITGNVTDCGCFGDFLKLKPIVSFSKDIFLGVLTALLVWKHDKITPLLKDIRIPTGILAVTAAGFLWFCFSNFYTGLPSTDFRPFKEGVNIPKQKAIEDANEDEIVRYMTLANKDTKEVKEVTATEYAADKTLWQQGTPWVLDKEKTREVVLKEGSTSKIKEFEFSNAEGIPVWEELMADPNYSFMVISYSREKSDKDAFQNKVNPLLNAAEKDGLKGFCVTALGDPEEIEDFRHNIQAAYPFHTADDILLKTIIRSNPGVLLMKNGTIVKKFHHRELPDYATIKGKFMK